MEVLKMDLQFLKNMQETFIQRSSTTSEELSKWVVELQQCLQHLQISIRTQLDLILKDVGHFKAEQSAPSLSSSSGGLLLSVLQILGSGVASWAGASAAINLHRHTTYPVRADNLSGMTRYPDDNNQVPPVFEDSWTKAFSAAAANLKDTEIIQESTLPRKTALQFKNNIY